MVLLLESAEDWFGKTDHSKACGSANTDVPVSHLLFRSTQNDQHLTSGARYTLQMCACVCMRECASVCVCVCVCVCIYAYVLLHGGPHWSRNQAKFMNRCTRQGRLSGVVLSCEKVSSLLVGSGVVRQRDKEARRRVCMEIIRV